MDRIESISPPPPVATGEAQPPKPGLARLPFIGGIVAGITASACCVGPLALVLAGVSGAWIGNLTALKPYSPIFAGIAIAFLGLAGWRLFVPAKACAPGTACADPRRLRNQRIVFLSVTVVLAALMGFQFYAPLFY
jgi:mercuric ion transport protein